VTSDWRVKAGAQQQRSFNVGNDRYQRVIRECQGLSPSYSPFEGGVGGCPWGTFLQTLLNPILNASQDIRHVTLHVPVMKSHDTQSELLQILLASLIPFAFVAVAVAIDLNHQF
jgi:hypothetical protein